MVGHDSGLYSHLTLRENLAFAARMGGVGDAWQRADQWLNTTGLKRHSDVLVAKLSRGMRQRLAVARALIHEPAILLLDEPFTALDVAGTQWLLTLLTNWIERGHTVCFVTHEQEKIQRLARRVLELRDGKVHDITAMQHNLQPRIRAA